MKLGRERGLAALSTSTLPGRGAMRAGVLDGDLDPFMQAALAQKAFGGEPLTVEDVE